MTTDFKNLDWLMPQLNLEDCLERLGVRLDRVRETEIRGWCPDHALFVGREPSHPKWYISKKTGMCYCQTEGRGSNIVFLTSRMRRTSPLDSVKFLLGHDIEEGNIELSKIKSKLLRFERLSKEDEDEEAKEVFDIESVQEEFEQGVMYERGLEYFMKPPGKLETGIKATTVRYFKCIERTWGRYRDRVIVPVFFEEKAVGFCAMDVLGKDGWKAKHPGSSLDYYKKVLFPTGFVTSKYIFNYDDILHGTECLVVTEGVRDAMKLRQEGLNATSLLGLYVSDEKMLLMASKRPKRLVVMLDGDERGRAASVKIAERLKEIAPTYIVDLPEGVDPKNLERDDMEEVLGEMKRFF